MECTCGSTALTYKGLGEYECDRCGNIIRDNYGKVYEYLEQHPGANVTEIEEATGVTDIKIAELVAHHRFVAKADPRLNIRCKRCDKPIILGDYCPECKMERERKLGQRMQDILNPKKEQPVRRGVATGRTDGNSGKRHFI